jgi:hypothetical protein
MSFLPNFRKTFRSIHLVFPQSRIRSIEQYSRNMTPLCAPPHTDQSTGGEFWPQMEANCPDEFRCNRQLVHRDAPPRTGQNPACK